MANRRYARGRGGRARFCSISCAKFNRFARDRAALEADTIVGSARRGATKLSIWSSLCRAFGDAVARRVVPLARVGPLVMSAAASSDKLVGLLGDLHKFVDFRPSRRAVIDAAIRASPKKSLQNPNDCRDDGAITRNWRCS